MEGSGQPVWCFLGPGVSSRESRLRKESDFSRKKNFPQFIGKYQNLEGRGQGRLQEEKSWSTNKTGKGHGDKEIASPKVLKIVRV